MSKEAARIVALKRAPDADDLGLGAGLRPVQIQALSRIKAAGGGIVAAGVGHGKFLISILAPTVLESKRALLLVPPPLLQQTRDELAKWQDLPRYRRANGRGLLDIVDNAGQANVA